VSGLAAQPQNIGVFGGAFDPPHRGHVALAEAAIAQLQLDALHIVPTGEAWHKARVLTPASHRLAMAQLAFADVDRVVVDEREILRGGPSYTVDTLQELQQENPGARLYLLIGEDQARALTTWKRWEEIVQLAIICVAARADSAGSGGLFDAPSQPGFPVQRLDMPPVPVSATDIRQRIAAHQSATPLVFESVARYIDLHHLYQTA
jgi:nicotinate-nucleotide adenylyltransferase